MAALAGSPECLFVRVADWIKADAARKREPASLARLDVVQMARELGVQEADLHLVLPHLNPHQGVLAGAMTLRELEAESATSASWQPMQYRVRHCTLCRATGRCRYARATGPGAHAGDAYCANAAAFSQPRPH